LQSFPSYFPEKRRPNPFNQKRRSTLPDTPWFTPELSKLRNLVLIFKDKYRSSGTLVDRNRLYKLYCETKQIHKRRTDSAKRLANTQLIENALNPCQTAWKLIHDRKDSYKPASKCTETNGTFNRYLLSSIDTVVDSIPAVDLNPLTGIRTSEVGLIRWRFVTPQEVVILVSMFRNSHSSDVYGVSVAVLRKVIYVIAAAVSTAISNCLRFGYFQVFSSICQHYGNSFRTPASTPSGKT
ncbi:hypothetical protein J6590_106145, partial [Homalodisca vitripennis]